MLNVRMDRVLQAGRELPQKEMGEATRESANWQWRSHQFFAMNTTVEVLVFGRTPNLPHVVERLFREAEQRMSRFLPDSELSRFNAAGAHPVKLSSELFAVLEMALAGAHATGGLFDPTVLNDLITAGYDQSFECLVQPEMHHRITLLHEEEAPKQVRTATYADIRLDPATLQATKPLGLRVDLGGLGKGWTVDRAAEALLGEGPFLVNAGGDLYAHGQPGDPRGWEILIEHPWAPGRWIARLHLDHMALATSTTTKRRWQHNGRIHHHLIDPRTGYPAKTDAASVTVLAPRTALAEIFAKAALLLGAEAGVDYLEQTPNVEGLIYTVDGRIVHTSGLTHQLDTLDSTKAPERPSPDGAKALGESLNR